MLKNVNYIKDSNNNLGVVKEKPVIFGRAIPENPMVGSRYYFGNNAKVKVKTTSDYGETRGIFNRNATIGQDSKRIYEAEYYNSIITIPENFDFDKFMTDESYLESIKTGAQGYTGPTESPYFEIKNGEIVCVKPCNLTVQNDSGSANIIFSKKEGQYLVKHKRKYGYVHNLKNKLYKTVTHYLNLYLGGDGNALKQDFNPSIFKNSRILNLHAICSHCTHKKFVGESVRIFKHSAPSSALSDEKGCRYKIL